METKQITLTESQKAFLEPLLEVETNARMMQLNGIKTEVEASKKLWKTIREMYPEIPDLKGSRPVLNYEEGTDWIITYVDK